MAKLLSKDPVTQLETWYHYDPTNDASTFEYKQDITSIIDANKSLHNTDYQRKGIKNCWMHGAIIPPIIQLKWLQEYGVDTYNPDHMPRVLKLLNDPEFKYLKTGNAKL